MKTKYYTKEELSKMVGKELRFLGFGKMIKVGKLTFEDGKKKYWLPFCGYVNAESVEIEVANV